MIRIGSRESALALWQAEKVQGLLEGLGLDCEIVKIKSKGDVILDKPLYELGVTGVFTKALDVALLHGDIDLAVHSMKDVPTLLPKGISEYAVLERGEVRDLLAKPCSDIENRQVLATGSLRRKAQWLHRNPTHEIVGIRGNVNTRLEKLYASEWRGAIFAKAGLERINVLPDNYDVLDWMVPAPAQGALMIVGLESNKELKSIFGKLNHEDSQLAVSIERAFLRTLEGGCTAPIGALAEVSGGSVKFTGVLNSLCGTEELRVEKQWDDASADRGAEAALELLENGGYELMADIRKHFLKGRILSTKILPEELSNRVIAAGYELVESDFIGITRKAHASISNDVVMISSKNALEGLDLKDRTIFCVGAKTSKAIEKNGGEVSKVFENSAAMAEFVAGNYDKATFVCGSRRMPDVESSFDALGKELEILEAYDTELTPTQVEGEFDAVLFYSPSTVESFYSCNTHKGIAVCIGETTKSEALKHGDKIVVSDNTSIESVVTTAIEELK